MIKGIIFDVDGVLVDTEKIHVEAWENVFCPKGITLSKDDYEKGIGIADKEFLIQLKNQKKIPKNLDIGRLCKEKEKYFLEIISNGVNVIDGVVEILNFLKEKKFKIAAASNSKMVFVKNVLKYGGIKDFFDVIVARESIKEAKPEPEIYIKTLELLKLKKNEVIVFEDSEVGIESAKRAGIFCVGIETTQQYDKLKKSDIILKKMDTEKIKDIIKGMENEE